MSETQQQVHIFKGEGGETEWTMQDAVDKGMPVDSAAECGDEEMEYVGPKPTGVAIGDRLGDGASGLVIAVALRGADSQTAKDLLGRELVVLCQITDSEFGAEWVTWICNPTNRSVFWGTYNTDLDAAKTNFTERCNWLNS